MKRQLSTLALGLALGLGAAVSPVAACPNCKEAVANQQPEEAARLSRGYSYSILLMLFMPVALLTTGTLAVARAVKRGYLPEM